jgi:N-acetyl-gamma-glutamyl-phosphate reductase
MEQALSWWSNTPPTLVFSPHLLPVPRGILSTIYVPLANGWSEGTLRDLYHQAYAGEAFMKLLPAGQLASLAHAVRTNRCVFSITLVSETLIITSVIDNLIKGAAGQALQNLNVMFGLPETAALE